MREMELMLENELIGRQAARNTHPAPDCRRAWFWLMCAGLLLAVQGPAAEFLTWSGGSASSGNWNVAANWDNIHTPGNGDTATATRSMAEYPTPLTAQVCLISAVTAMMPAHSR